MGTGGGLNIYSDIRDFVNILKSDLKAGDVVLHLGYNCWEKSKAEFENYLNYQSYLIENIVKGVS